MLKYELDGGKLFSFFADNDGGLNSFKEARVYRPAERELKLSIRHSCSWPAILLILGARPRINDIGCYYVY